MQTGLNDFIDELQLAERCKVSDKTVQRWRNNGGGPAYVRIGRRVIYSVAEVDRWLAANTFPHRAAESVRRVAWNAKTPDAEHLGRSVSAKTGWPLSNTAPALRFQGSASIPHRTDA